jgi:hypothetical protein
MEAYAESEYKVIIAAAVAIIMHEQIKSKLNSNTTVLCLEITTHYKLNLHILNSHNESN